MFRCDSCKKSIGPSIPVIFKVTEKREKVYINDGIQSKGWEIVKEAKLCEPCAKVN